MPPRNDSDIYNTLIGSPNKNALANIDRKNMNRFSIREILMLVVILALAMGWWVDRRSGLIRFQMHATSNHSYVLDTVTGQVWHARLDPTSGGYFGSNDFTDIKLPE
jgi:di/tricarboxylate transporter